MIVNLRQAKARFFNSTLKERNTNFREDSLLSEAIPYSGNFEEHISFKLGEAMRKMSMLEKRIEELEAELKEKNAIIEGLRKK